MYPQTKTYIKRQILKLIEQCNDEEHKQGEVTIDDIQYCINELGGRNMPAGYHDVEKYYEDRKEEVGNILVNYDEDTIYISDFGIANIETYNQLINDLIKAKEKLGW